MQRCCGWISFMVCVGIFCPTTTSAECTGTPYKGNVPYVLAKSAFETNAKTYGAVGVLERHILPSLAILKTDNWNDWDQGGGALYIGSDTITDALRLPAKFTGSDCQSQFGTMPYDLYSFNIAAGARYGGISLFYSAGATTGAASSSNGERWGNGLANFATGYYYTALAPLFGATTLELDDGVSRLSVDYIAGIGLETRAINGRIGYVGSKGFYGSIDQNRLKVFTNALIQDYAGKLDLSYLKFGKRGFAWFQDIKEDPPTLGTTDLYGRKQRLAVPNLDTLDASIRDKALEQVELWTAHIAQRNIFKYVDIEGSYTILPQPDIHELIVSAHSSGYNYVLNLGSSFEEPSHNRRELSSVEFAVKAGLVQFPEAAYFGIPEGPRFAFNADMLIPNFSGYDRAFLRIRLMRNEPEILDLFPYAEDAWQFHVSALVVGMEP